jgi:hypothetical protein
MEVRMAEEKTSLSALLSREAVQPDKCLSTEEIKG